MSAISNEIDGLESQIEKLQAELEEKTKTIGYQLENYEKLQAQLSQAKKANDELSERLEAAEKVIEFYGDKDNWVEPIVGGLDEYRCDTILDDHGDTPEHFGGKRAREYQRKYKVKNLSPAEDCK